MRDEDTGISPTQIMIEWLISNHAALAAAQAADSVDFLAERLRLGYETKADKDMPDGLFAELARAALGLVDWRLVAEILRDETFQR